MSDEHGRPRPVGMAGWPTPPHEVELLRRVRALLAMWPAAHDDELPEQARTALADLRRLVAEP